MRVDSGNAKFIFCPLSGLRLKEAVFGLKYAGGTGKSELSNVDLMKINPPGHQSKIKR